MSPVIVALDFDTRAEALQLARQLPPSACRMKVGKTLFTREGPDVVKALQDAGFDVFLDLKFHDIPNTVAGAIRAAAELGVWMVNVHAAGGGPMLDAAREAANSVSRPPLLIAVTVLTSMDEATLHTLGVTGSLAAQVDRLAALTHAHGLDGVVCSVREVQALKARFGKDFLTVTPGIRLPGNAADDQTRVETPASARASGSDYWVVGRPITRAQDPRGVLGQILEQAGLS
ncbi:MAG: orotidine-5'-phosphate decarboxylase [Cardiobacteriaceae bacterium]|nr:orotidine-5'-phosphate decarboxylase [Cardiobacteriaceae bacterium]